RLSRSGEHDSPESETRRDRPAVRAAIAGGRLGRAPVSGPDPISAGRTRPPRRGNHFFPARPGHLRVAAGSQSAGRIALLLLRTAAGIRTAIGPGSALLGRIS